MSVFEPLIRSFICAFLYGVMENRFFFEGRIAHGHVKWFLEHFKTYHLLTLLLFAVISFTSYWLVWVWCMFMMPLVQDVTWQAIERRRLKRVDWSNIGGVPLVFNVYLWYWVDLLWLVIFGLLMFVL